MSRSLILGLFCAVGALLASAPAEAARTETKTYPVTIDWRIGYHSVSTCASWGLATWREQAGAVAWKLLYHFSPTNPDYAGDRSKTLSPPFDDDEFDQFGWKPAKGTHWDGLSYSGRSSLGGNPVSCSDNQAKQKAIYSKVRIEITTDARIVGRVKDPAGDGVSGVRVTAKGAGSDRTDVEGRYQIDVPETNKTYKVVPTKGKSKFKPPKRSVTVKPGQTKKANFTMKTKRTISGTIKLGCKSSCSVDGRLPVAGVKLRATSVGNASAARSYNVASGTDGKYKLYVKKGKYQVTTRNSTAESTPSRKTLNLTDRRTGKANFEVCPHGTGSSATASSVPSGTWESGLQDSVYNDCLNRFTVGYDQEQDDYLFVGWEGVPECVFGGETYADIKRLAYVVFGPVLPGTYAGHQKQVNDAQVEFSTTGTLDNPTSRSASLSGFIHGAGRGAISEAYAVAPGPGCRFEATGVPLKNYALLME